METLYFLIAPLPQSFALTLTALFGLAFGSFLNVCITRLPQGESVQHPRSHCRNCPRNLPWYENIPLLSFLALRGQCRGCHAPIPIRYPLVEATLAALWVACYLHFGATPLGGRAGILCFLLLGLAVTDFETLLLPNAMTIPGIVVGLAISALPGPDRNHYLLLSVTGALLGASILLLISGIYYLLRRRQGMGLGDVKLLAMIGAFLGPLEVLLVLVLGTVATAIASLLWLSLHRHASSQTSRVIRWTQHPMPYGTFLAAAGIFALFFGARILNWYLGLGA
jgi:leader peptidase (prepilin peptidase)/N-methyltransferase